tara:strand:- start:1460 stop:2173 length:714 start_codon:yes stop_codon:yes gene_type:complete
MNNFWDEKFPPDYYDKNLNFGLSKKRGIQSNWHNITFLSVKEKIKINSKHLDYACGPGSFIGIYLQNQSIGVDISKNQIKFAKKKYGDKGKFFEINEFDFNKYESFFDSVSAIGLFEYLDDEETILFLNEMDKILKPGGKLIITTPNYGLPMKILEKALHILGPVDYSSEHKNKHNFKSLSKLMESSSFSFKINKLLNIGITFSFINLNIGIIINKLIEKITFKKFGFLLFVLAQKK